ncbi:uncharacterized protein L969DRAFT_92267 [Mixia osmundae IAM 14324]|uniref:Tetrapyrrole biosynthesis uroporphyrinogen III synthase domain-containing protein n=1 Tax=Mixia osmundae (strain CBS 9802 / IAM 14324 / JCM 22182 / KY 12970) TaxID=764103 RepID=G7DTG8_MIXOS|nr:uncharacterized protein L969DRAFT_92267 [Mixia osmundae IAM 14324]KEI42847.1 hypothetical protein L969DRAFT_92267 [Mixia osmundae IAM 14324]GAA93815.1 hypothetical protein E5Q_00461 [Mixia osmundae IAM 14324]
MKVSRVILLKEPRNDEDEDPYMLLFANAGYETRFVAPLCATAVEQTRLQELIAKGPATRFSGVIFTSKRAVSAWNDAASTLPCPPTSRWSEVPFFVVGPSTGEMLASVHCNGRPTRIIGSQRSGTGALLADLIIREHATELKGTERPLLFLTGDKTRDTLPIKLAAADLALEQMQVYQTTDSPRFQDELAAALRELGKDEQTWLAFFSPSGVRAVRATLECSPRTAVDQASLRVAAIGPTTEEALRKTDLFEVHAIADQPEPESLLEAMQRYES